MKIFNKICIYIFGCLLNANTIAMPNDDIVEYESITQGHSISKCDPRSYSMFAIMPFLFSGVLDAALLGATKNNCNIMIGVLASNFALKCLSTILYLNSMLNTDDDKRFYITNSKLIKIDNWVQSIGLLFSLQNLIYVCANCGNDSLYSSFYYIFTNISLAMVCTRVALVFCSETRMSNRNLC